jgi:hypothetical protein
LFLFGHRDDYEAFMRTARLAHKESYARVAVNFVLSMPRACSTTDTIAAMVPDALYTRGVVGLPLKGWAWEFFVDIASRYPFKVQEVLQTHALPALGTCYAGAQNGLAALQAVLLQDMLRFTATVTATGRLRWAFISEVAALSLEKSLSDVVAIAA